MKTAYACIGIGIFAAIMLLISWATYERHEKAVATAAAKSLAADLAIMKRVQAATDRAAIERAADTARITDQDKELTNAILTAPDDPGAAARALNCRVWQQQHTDRDAPPACR